MKQRWRVIAAAVLLTALLYPAVRSLDLTRLATAMADAKWWPMACAALTSVILCTGAGTLRLHILIDALPGGTAPSVGHLYAVYLASSAAQNLMPAPAAEILRTIHVARRQGYSVADVTAAHLVEKVVDALAIVMCVLALIAAGGMPHGMATPASLFVAMAVVGAVGTFALARRSTQLSARDVPAPATALRRALTRVSTFLRQTIDGLRTLRSPRTWLVASAWSFLSEVANMVTVGLVLSSVGESLPLGAWIAVVVVARLSGVLPTTPGQFGVQEGVVALVLGAFGVEPSRAMAAALIYRTVHFVPTTLAGAVVLRQLSKLPDHQAAIETP